MAKAKKSAPKNKAPVAQVIEDDEIETGIDADTDPESESDEAQQQNDAIAELRGLGAGTDYRFTVNRIASKPGEQQGYCATYSAGDLSLDSIRDTFGGGKYRVRVTDSAGRYIALRTVDIVALPKPAAAAAPPPGTDMQGIAAIVQAIKSNAGEAAGGGNFQSVLLAMMQSQADMFKTILSRPVEKTSLTDVLALINASKERQPAGGDAVSMLLKGLELGKSLGGSGETGMLDVARDGLGILGTLISQKKDEPAALEGAQPTAQRALPAPSQPSTTAPAGAPGNDMMILQKLGWLRKQLASLIVQAERGKDAELYAEVMLDNLPPFFTPDEIMQRLQAPDALAQLASLDARVKQHEAWFEEFRAACVEFLAPPSTPASSQDLNSEDFQDAGT